MNKWMIALGVATLLAIFCYKTYNGQAPDEDLKFTFEVYENVNVSKNGTVSYAGTL